MEVVEVDGDLSLNNVFEHTALCKFKTRFELHSVCSDFRFVNINIKTLPFIYGLNLEQYDVDVILNRLNFHLKIVCSSYLFNGFIRSLKIKIYNLNKQKEIASCTNFLQRQKNLHLALNVMRKCSKLFEERKIVLQALTDRCPEYFTVTKTDDAGYVVTSLDKQKNFLFFESNWSIGWNYRNYDVFDFVDFMLNSRDKLFNTKAKPIMKSLTNPHNSATVKLKFWGEIMDFVQSSLDTCSVQGVHSYVSNDSWNRGGLRSSKRYKNLLENKEFYLIHPEIIEIDSDEETCLEVEDSDNDVEIVGKNFECGTVSLGDDNLARHREKKIPSILIDDTSD